MKRKMLLLFMAGVLSMAGVLNAQCDDAVPVCPERVAIAYEILLAEVQSDFIENFRQQVTFDIRRNSEGSRRSGSALLSNLETYFFTQAIAGDERSSVLVRPKKFVVPFDTKYGFITGNAESWYEIAVAPQRWTPEHVRFNLTFVRKVLREGKEEACRYEMPNAIIMPDGGTMLATSTLGDKEVILLITPRTVVLDE